MCFAYKKVSVIAVFSLLVARMCFFFNSDDSLSLLTANLMGISFLPSCRYTIGFTSIKLMCVSSSSFLVEILVKQVSSNKNEEKKRKGVCVWKRSNVSWQNSLRCKINCVNHGNVELCAMCSLFSTARTKKEGDCEQERRNWVCNFIKWLLHFRLVSKSM